MESSLVVVPAAPSGAASGAAGGRHITLFITSIAGFLAFLDSSIVNIAFPAIRGHFAGTPFSTLSWVLTAYNLTFAAALVPMGRLADRTGRRPLFIAGLMTFTVASAACAAAPSASVLIAARVLQALGAAALVPTAQALYLPLYSSSERPRAIALFGVVAAAAAAAGPTLGGILVQSAGWRWVFIINVPISLAAVAATLRWVSEPVFKRASRLPDFLGIALLTVALGTLAYGLSEGSQRGWTDPLILASFTAALLTAGLFVRRSSGHENPAVPLQLFRIRSFSVATLAGLAFGAGFYALTFANVQFLVNVWHMSIISAGFTLAPSAVAAAVIAPRAGRLISLRSSRFALTLGASLFALGACWYRAILTSRPDVALYVAGAVVVGAGIGLAFPALSSAQVSTLTSDEYSVASAVGNTARQVGAVLGVALSVAVLRTASSLTDFHRGWELSIAAAVIAAGLGLMLPRPASQ